MTHQWDIPDRPWYRLHIDFAGPFYGKMWLIVVDALSKYPEVVPLQHATASTTIQALRSIFARFGLPVQLVSDNGSQFTDKQFQDFLHRNGIVHFRVAPHHPASNGEAERFVQTFKRAMTKTSGIDEESLNLALNTFLLSYRRSPNTTTGQSPSDVLFGRPIRTRFDLLRPDLYEKLRAKREPDRDTNKFQVGDIVWVRNFSGPEKWKPGEIVRLLGTATYEVQVGSQLYHRHENQLRSRLVLPTELSAEEEDERVDRAWDSIAERPARRVEPANQVPRQLDPLPRDRVLPAVLPQATNEEVLKKPIAVEKQNEVPRPLLEPPVAVQPEQGVLRKSTRVRKPVQRFGDFDYGKGVR